MNKVPRLKKYAELFRRNLSRFLAPGIHVRTVIYPVEQEGAVFEFLLNKDADEAENVEWTRMTVGAVLGSIPQRLIAVRLRVSGSVEPISLSRATESSSSKVRTRRTSGPATL
jgi:hypothetical protein